MELTKGTVVGQIQNYYNTMICTLLFMLSLLHGWRNVLTSHAKIVDNFRRNTFESPWEILAEKWGLGIFHHNY
jgi:hypothetical protein